MSLLSKYRAQDPKGQEKVDWKPQGGGKISQEDAAAVDAQMRDGGLLDVGHKPLKAYAFLRQV